MGVAEAGSVDISRAAVPDNPNAVVFAIDARTRLPGQSWADMVREAAEATEVLHTSSGRPVYAGWAWRVVLDRKNKRLLHLLLWVLFDGPATAAHLDALDRSVRARVAGAGPGCIERVPVNCASAVLWRGGRACFPWHLMNEPGALGAIRLTEHDGQLRAETLLRATATRDEVPEEFEPILAVEAEYGEEQREDERLRLSFAMHYTDLIVAADGVVRDRESSFVANLFPDDLVRALGLHDPTLRASSFERASTVLRDRIGHHDKLALIGLFFSACYSDGTLDAREVRVLKDAGAVLGLSKEEVVKYLRRFW